MNIKNVITILVVMGITMVLTNFFSQSERVTPNKQFSEFPDKIGQFVGSRSSLDERIYNVLGVDDYILSDYRKKSGEIVNFYVGFYQSQKEGDLIHSPKNCMPGAGWSITKTTRESIPVAGRQEPITVIKLLIQKGSEKQVVLYWFQSRGRIIASEYMQKIWLVIDSIVKHRTDGAFVRLITPVIDSEAKAVDTLKEFGDMVFPILIEHLPS